MAICDCIKVVLIIFIASCHCSLIYVEKNGNDVANCWKLGQSCPCATLDYALEGAQLFQDVQIHIAPGTYKLSDNNATCFTGKSSFSLMGEERGTVRVVCDNYTGLSFINSSNIQIYNVTFLSCGAEHISSSNDIHSSSDSHTAYLSFLTGLYFLFCTNVSLSHVEVSDSVGTGLVLYSTGGTNYMTQCTFNNNTAYNRSNKYSAGGGGVAIEFLFCKPGDTDCLEEHPSKIDTMHQQNVSYVFTNCTFSNNNGSTNNFSGDSFIVPHANHNIALGRGGGLSVLFKGNSYANQVTLHNCTFRDNIAVWGGGMLIEFQDMAKNNTVSLKKVTFTNNRCDYNPCTYQGTGGGGARIQFAGFSKNVSGNIVGVYDTVFSGNAAYFGGGVSFFTFPEPNQTWSTNSLHFSNTVWLQNRARLGSAVDLSLWSLTNGAAVNPIFDECNFTNNTVHYADISGIPEGIGTVYTNSIPIAFNKSVHFTDNKGSALVSLDAGVEFHSDNIVVFYNNKGCVGAAITLFSQAYILVNERSLLLFENNTAALYGGGIYWESIGDHQLISSRNCFIRYKNMFLDPTDWNASFNFSYNRAGIAGNSIYATTLLSCLWGGNPYGKLIDPEQEYCEVFYWKPNNESLTIWNYNNEDSSNKSEVATAPAYFSDGNNALQCGTVYNSGIVPGETTSLPVYMLDDRFVQVPNKSLIFVAERHATDDVGYIIPNTVTLSGLGDDEIKISTIESRIITTHVNVKFEPCPPGFQYNIISEKCDGAKYPFILANTNFTASIQYGYWIGYVDNNRTKLGVGQCFYCPVNNKLQYTSYVALPKSNEDLDAYFCKPLNRKGVLCGECIEGYAPAVNSFQYTCIKCSSENIKYSWLLYILSEYVPITAILVCVVIFNISITSGPTNSFVFFAQVISTTFGITANGLLNYSTLSPASKTLDVIYTSLYGVWNLNFIQDITSDKWLYCLGPGVTPLHIQALRYTSAVYPLIVIVIAGILLSLYDKNVRIIVFILHPLHKLSARFLKKLKLRNSIMDTFATFLVLSYVKFAVLSAVLLYPGFLYGEDGTLIYLAAFKYASVKFLSWQYAPYMTVAILVYLFCIIIPFVLLLYSIKPYYMLLEKYKMKFLLPGLKLQQFLTSFHHCYKDGSNGEHDRRYMASLYFFLRLILISAYAYSPDWAIQYFFQQIICTIGIIIFGIVQPYKRKWHNALDACMFGLLSVINICTFYNRYRQFGNADLSAPVYWFQLILICIPLFYITCYIVYHLGKSNMPLKRWYSKKKTEWDTFNFNEYINDVTAEGRLYKQNIYHITEDDDNFLVENDEIQSEFTYFDDNATDTGLHKAMSYTEIDVDDDI